MILNVLLALGVISGVILGTAGVIALVVWISVKYLNF